MAEPLDFRRICARSPSPLGRWRLARLPLQINFYTSISEALFLDVSTVYHDPPNGSLNVSGSFQTIFRNLYYKNIDIRYLYNKRESKL